MSLSSGIAVGYAFYLFHVLHNGVRETGKGGSC